MHGTAPSPRCRTSHPPRSMLTTPVTPTYLFSPCLSPFPSFKLPNPPTCCTTPPPPVPHPHLPPSLSSSSLITLLPRRPDYKTHNPDPPHLEEPHLIALVATSHDPSPLNPSASIVKHLISHLHPDAVVVELCRSRATMLAPPTKSQMFLARVATMLHLPLRGLFSPHIGREFRAAREAAEQEGAVVVLGDRPVRVTLRRAWGNLSVGDKVLLCIAFLGRCVWPWGVDEELKAVVERGEGGGDIVARYLGRLKEWFPGLFRTLVEERDMYLAWSLKRSRAVRGRQCVVGVVGRAHVEGIVRWIREDDRERRKGGSGVLVFRRLVGKE